MGRNGQGDAPLMPNPTPVDLELDWVLGKMPQKVHGVGAGGGCWDRRLCFPLSWPIYPTCALSPVCPALPKVLTPLLPSVLQEFFLQRSCPLLQPLVLPTGLSVRQALERVLRLPAVASKRYLTNKVLPALLPCPQPSALLPQLIHPWPPTLGDWYGGPPGLREKEWGSRPNGMVPCYPSSEPTSCLHGQGKPGLPPPLCPCSLRSCQPHLVPQVDRSVGGLVAQQQCVGPLQTPLADVAVVALSHHELVGAATSLGEQPVKSLLDPKVAARLAVAEALTNLVFALVTDLRVSPHSLCHGAPGLWDTSSSTAQLSLFPLMLVVSQRLCPHPRLPISLLL